MPLTADWSSITSITSGRCQVFCRFIGARFRCGRRSPRLRNREQFGGKRRHVAPESTELMNLPVFNPGGQEHNEKVGLRVDPERGAGIPGMAEGFLGETVAPGRRIGGGDIPASPRTTCPPREKNRVPSSDERPVSESTRNPVQFSFFAREAPAETPQIRAVLNTPHDGLPSELAAGGSWGTPRKKVSSRRRLPKQAELSDRGRSRYHSSRARRIKRFWQHRCQVRSDNLGPVLPEE